MFKVEAQSNLQPTMGLDELQEGGGDGSGKIPTQASGTEHLTATVSFRKHEPSICVDVRHLGQPTHS